MGRKRQTDNRHQALTDARRLSLVSTAIAFAAVVQIKEVCPLTATGDESTALPNELRKPRRYVPDGYNRPQHEMGKKMPLINSCQLIISFAAEFRNG